MQRVHPMLAPLPIRAAAIQWLRDWGVKIVVRDPRASGGGGFWWPDKKLVELFTGQEEAAIHEIAHAWWDPRRLEDHNAAKLMVAVVHLSEEPDPRYARAAELARYYVYGIPSAGRPELADGLVAGDAGRRERLGDVRGARLGRDGRHKQAASVPTPVLRGPVRAGRVDRSASKQKGFTPPLAQRYDEVWCPIVIPRPKAEESVAKPSAIRAFPANPMGLRIRRFARHVQYAPSRVVMLVSGANWQAECLPNAGLVAERVGGRVALW